MKAVTARTQRLGREDCMEELLMDDSSLNDPHIEVLFQETFRNEHSHERRRLQCFVQAAYRLEVHATQPGSEALSHKPSNGLLLNKMSTTDLLHLVQANEKR